MGYRREGAVGMGGREGGCSRDGVGGEGAVGIGGGRPIRMKYGRKREELS